MRIQHNIMAMNAYRNYINNSNALSKNLEKLSSGYKINRAGDDAAGLAISEKMRAQITGLEAAQKNVKDGINLVKTAEGAMQEIHDMLNRMDYLATQSANGTYQDPVDRENLNKEVTSLKNEINRIADSANFNGIKLLDGSQAAGGASDSATPPTFNANLTVNSHDAIKGKYETLTVLANQTGLVAGDVIELSFNLEDANGSTKAVSMKFTVGAASDGTAKGGLIAEDGTVIDLGTAGTVAAADLDKITSDVLSKSKEFEGLTLSNGTSGKITFEANEAGTSAPKVTAFEIRNNHTGKFVSVTNGVSELKKAMDKSYTADLNNTTALLWDDGKEDSLADKTITIGDKKFVFIDNGKVSADTLKYMKDAGIDHYVEVNTVGAIDDADVKAMVEKMNLEGLNVEQGEWNTTNAEWGKDATKTQIIVSSSSLQSGGGLTLQIGDTADSWNQLNVSIGDMHTTAMGTGKTTLDGKEIEVTKTIADIDIGNITGAQEAIGVIKNAINYVSSVRGDLGAIQNRLEHTQNNLSVMQENIQDAESAIRDTDVAAEMMKYTKNNILIQSAQAMLAQANAVPQGVLQLLQ